VARVLYELVTETSAAGNAATQQLREQLLRQAARIAINRTVAGVHYPVDSLAGQLLGLAVADYILARFGAGGNASANVPAWEFDGLQLPAGTDFSGNELYDFVADQRTTKPYAKAIAATPLLPVARSPKLKWLWDQARLEW